MAETNTLIPLKVHGVLVDPNTDTQIVVLRDEQNSEVLPIWVGTAEGTSIRLALENVVPPRPMSHDLICSFASYLGFSVNKVVITEVKNNTYFSTIFLEKDGLEKGCGLTSQRCHCPGGSLPMPYFCDPGSTRTTRRGRPRYLAFKT